MPVAAPSQPPSTTTRHPNAIRSDQASDTIKCVEVNAACEGIANALTIDLEDWAQSTLGHRMPITDCVIRNTERLLALLDEHRVHATFFALGKVCEAYPDLLPRIVRAGHEIASHGWGHQLVHRLTPQEFEADVSRSVTIIESQTGVRPLGYRAPGFSVTRATPWVGPILERLGFRYSSSVFPIAGRRYGIRDAIRFPHQWKGCNLDEFPLLTIRRFARNWPAAGGGYLRLLPQRIVARAVVEMNRQGRHAVLYMHPYEMAPREIAELRRAGWSIKTTTRIHQSMFRGRFEHRLRALLTRFRFQPIRDLLNSASRV